MAEPIRTIISPPIISVCVVIPTYNNQNAIKNVIDGAKQHFQDEAIIVVDDGSKDATTGVLEAFGGIHVVSLGRNFGKGYALQAGFKKAVELGFSHAITMDGDGQHLDRDIPVFMEKINSDPEAIWVGSREKDYEHSAPMHVGFSIGMKFWSSWFKFNTGVVIHDTQCGFRAYPLQAVQALHCRRHGFEYEKELIIKAAWTNIPVREIPVHFHYQPKVHRASFIRIVFDFLRIGLVNTKAAMLRMTLPVSILERPGLTWKQRLKMMAQHEIHANTTPWKAATSFAVGVGTALSPIHGLQIIVLIYFCYKFKLNKPLSFLGLSFSSPPLLPFVIGAAYALGNRVTPEFYFGGHLRSIPLSIQKIMNGTTDFIIGSMLMSIVGAILAFGIAFPLFKILSRKKS